MNNLDSQYIKLCKKILNEGNTKTDRTGTGTLSLFGEEIRVDLNDGFPLLTTKEVHFKSVVGELLWFIKGETNIQFLKDNKVKIWDSFANEQGEVGDMYGLLWRNWDEVDQIANLITSLKTNPNSRRHLVSAWDPSNLPDESISPVDNVNIGNPSLGACHYSFQCYVNDGKLSLIFNMRSCDIFLGLPFNIASYALLTHMLAQVCDLQVGELIWRGGDCHIYSNHVIQMRTQLLRFENGFAHHLPKLVLTSNITDIDSFGFDDIKVGGYKHAGKLSGRVAV